MGAWGSGLYQDDVACEVRDYYIDCLRDEDESAEDKTINYFQDELNDDDDCAVVWFALADTQWKYGRLSETVKSKALEYIDNGINLQLWTEADEKLYSKRENVLADLKKKLESPQPPKKRIPKQRRYICPWKIGDVFAFQINNEELNQHPLFHRWIVLQKVGNVEWYPCHTIPVMTAINSLKTTCPTLEEISEFRFIKIGKHYFQRDNQGLPIGDFKYDYDFGLVMTSKRNIPDTFVYLGNRNVERPTNAYIRSQEKKAELFYFSWKDIEKGLTNRFSDFG